MPLLFVLLAAMPADAGSPATEQRVARCKGYAVEADSAIRTRAETLQEVSPERARELTWGFVQRAIDRIETCLQEFDCPDFADVSEWKRRHSPNDGSDHLYQSLFADLRWLCRD